MYSSRNPLSVYHHKTYLWHTKRVQGSRLNYSADGEVEKSCKETFAKPILSTETAVAVNVSKLPLVSSGTRMKKIKNLNISYHLPATSSPYKITNNHPRLTPFHLRIEVKLLRETAIMMQLSVLHPLSLSYDSGIRFFLLVARSRKLTSFAWRLFLFQSYSLHDNYIILKKNLLLIFLEI